MGQESGVEEEEEAAEDMEQLQRRVKNRMGDDDELWRHRPLGRELIRYAVHGCVRLRALYLRQLRAAEQRLGVGEPEPGAPPPVPGSYNEKDFASRVKLQTTHFLRYSTMNLHIPRASDAAKIGTVLWALCCARTSHKNFLYWKLNLGRTGVTSTPSALGRFKDVRVGDAVLCVVSGVSIRGEFLYLDKYDHDWAYHEFRERPVDSGSGNIMPFGREPRHQVGLGSDAVDPLLLREEGVADHYPEEVDLEYGGHQ
eukprot:g4639.t1